MKALVLAAGLGTRLKPWTDCHPKALVPVGGVPMLERVVVRLLDSGFNDIVVNVHHYAGQIVEFVKSKQLPVKISDECSRLLDTGGGIVKASEFMDGMPFLIHNVDILGNANLKELYCSHVDSGNDATLLVSDRESNRKLLFDEDMGLRGWHNSTTGEFRPAGCRVVSGLKEYSFSGIHVVGSNAVEEMRRIFGSRTFPVMDYYLTEKREATVGGVYENGLELIDIGKPETLSRAEGCIK